MRILGLKGLTENIRALFPQGQAKLFIIYIEVCVLIKRVSEKRVLTVQPMAGLFKAGLR